MTIIRNILISIILITGLTTPVYAFELELLNDNDKIMAGYVLRIDHGIEEFGDQPAVVCGAELKPGKSFISTHDREPGLYYAFWTTPFEVENSEVVKYIFKVKPGIPKVVLTPVHGIGCKNCDRKEVSDNIWLLKPLKYY